MSDTGQHGNSGSRGSGRVSRDTGTRAEVGFPTAGTRFRAWLNQRWPFRRVILEWNSQGVLVWMQHAFPFRGWWYAELWLADIGAEWDAVRLSVAELYEVYQGQGVVLDISRVPDEIDLMAALEGRVAPRP